MASRLRVLAGLLIGSLALGGCSLLPGNRSDDVALLVDQLEAGLAEHSLAGIPLSDPADEPRHAVQVAALASYPVEVSAADVERSGDSATVALRWRWQIEGQSWDYDSQADLVEADGQWVVAWNPSTLVPSLGDNDVIRVDRAQPPRAMIAGAQGVGLVTDRPVVRFGLDKSKVNSGQVGRSATRIAQELDIDPDAFRRTATAAGPKAFVEGLVLRKGAARGQVGASFDDIPGALALPDEIALAPTREFAASILGTVGPATAEIIEDSDGRVREGDQVGLSGLQARYDELLAGRPGVRVRAIGTQACAQWPKCEPAGEPRELTSWPATPGRPLQLTLDLDLQLAAEQALVATGGQDAPASALVAIRPSTGQVLAAANGPGNDGLNAATYGQYAPGSTFKVVTALALLRAGMSRDDIVSCPATIEVDGKTFKNYDGYPPDRLGDISLTRAIANSCNTALIGERARLDADELSQAAAALGLGVDHDLGFPAFFGKVPPAVGETEKAAALIGQGKVLASPLAMATVAASVSAGHAVVPRLIENRTDSQGGQSSASPTGPAPEPATAPEPERPLTNAEAKDLRALMRAVVTEGSGQFLADIPGEVGAKTGTAEYGTPDASGELPTHTWMIATRGDLAVAVFVETGESGSQTAGPILEAFLR